MRRVQRAKTVQILVPLSEVPCNNSGGWTAKRNADCPHSSSPAAGSSPASQRLWDAVDVSDGQPSIGTCPQRCSAKLLSVFERRCDVSSSLCCHIPAAPTFDPAGGGGTSHPTHAPPPPEVRSPSHREPAPPSRSDRPPERTSARTNSHLSRRRARSHSSPEEFCLLKNSEAERSRTSAEPQQNHRGTSAEPQ